jgi:Spy/CpxP family protein refolding chaperone
MKTIRWWLLAMFAVAGIAFAAGRWTSIWQANADPLREGLAIDLSWLGLSAAQAAALAELEPLRHAFQATYDRQCEARCRLARALKPDAWDPAALRAHVERMCDAHRARELATLEYLMGVERILTPEQRALSRAIEPMFL